MIIITENFRIVKTGVNVKALFTLAFDNGLRLNHCKIVQQLGQKAWLALPSVEWTDKTGKRRYEQAVRLPDEWKVNAEAVALAAYEAAILEEGSDHAGR